MKVTVTRYSESHESTLGLLHVDGQFQCYTLEDEYRAKKLYGETRIPEGVYRLSLRTYGGHHDRYKKRFPTFHVGMIQIDDVPNFTDILFHIGNTDKDTAGCLLVGNNVDNNQIGRGQVLNSTDAYIAMYKRIAPQLYNGDIVNVHIYNLFGLVK